MVLVVVEQLCCCHAIVGTVHTCHFLAPLHLLVGSAELGRKVLLATSSGLIAACFVRSAMAYDVQSRISECQYMLVPYNLMLAGNSCERSRDLLTSSGRCLC